MVLVCYLSFLIWMNDAIYVSPLSVDLALLHVEMLPSLCNEKKKKYMFNVVAFKQCFISYLFILTHTQYQLQSVCTYAYNFFRYIKLSYYIY